MRKMLNRVRLYIKPSGLLATALVTALSASVPLVAPMTAHAQNNIADSGSSNGMRITPLRIDLTVAPGESKIVDVGIQNVTGSPAELRMIANDFVAGNDENGTPRILFDENSSAPSHGLKKYIQPVQNFTLAPKEQRTIKVTVKMPKDVAGGGYYGAVRFLPVANSKNKNISLTASVGTLLLVTVPGDVKEQIGVSSINVSRDAKDAKASSFFTNGKNLKTTIRFKNSGNVQQAPFGKVSLKKSGKEIANYEINKTEPKGTILPDSIRRFEVKMGDSAQSFGKYTVEGYFGYGDKGQLITASTTFYVVPLVYLVLAGIVITLIVLLGFIVPRMLKEHDRRLIKRMRAK